MSVFRNDVVVNRMCLMTTFPPIVCHRFYDIVHFL